MKKKAISFLTAFLTAISCTTTMLPTITGTAIAASTSNVKFDEDEFYVAVGTCKGATQLRYFAQKSDGSYTVEKVVWEDAPADISYGDVFIGDGNIEMTKVMAAPDSPVYAMAYYYQLDDGAKLNKVGKCDDFMEKKVLTVSSKTYDGSAHWSIRYKDSGGKEYYYGLSNFASTLTVDPLDCEVGDVYTYALCNDYMVIPLAKENDISDVYAEPEYKIVKLPDKVEYKLGEQIDLKGIEIEVTKDKKEPVVYTYPDVAFDYQSNIPKSPSVVLSTDFRNDKAGTYKVEVVGADNVSFDVEVVDDSTIKDLGVFEEGEMMTLDDVVELSKKGNALTLNDFAKFKGVIAGSGIFILEYDLGKGYTLMVGSVALDKIDYARLRYTGSEKYIDIRTDDVKEYIASMTVPVVNENETVTYKIITLPDKTVYKLGESISLKGIQVEVKKGNEEPVIYTYPDVAFDYQSDIPKAPTVTLSGDYKRDKVGTVAIKVIGSDDVLFNVEFVDDSAVKENSVMLTTESGDDGCFIHLDLMSGTFTMSGSIYQNFAVFGKFERKGNDLYLYAENGSTNVYVLHREDDHFISQSDESGIRLTKGLVFSAENDTFWEKLTSANESTVKGDANCDGSVDMADAVLIMQALANPNKYGLDGTAEHHLTEQGKLNGDMNGDGLTSGDALAIQRKLLGLDNDENTDNDVTPSEPTTIGFSNYEEYKKYIEENNLADKIVTYDKLSQYGEFVQFTINSHWMYDNTFSLFYIFNDGSGKNYDLIIHDHPQQLEDLVAYPKLTDDLINKSDMRTANTDADAYYEFDNKYYIYTNGKLSQIKWFDDKHIYILIGNPMLYDYPKVDNTYMSKLLDISSTTSTDNSVIAGKIFAYEKEGAGGYCTLSFNENGRFLYSPGKLSSYMGGGDWKIDGDTVSLIGMVDKTIYLKITDDTLVYIAEGSDEFPYMDIKDGEKFGIYRPEISSDYFQLNSRYSEYGLGNPKVELNLMASELPEFCYVENVKLYDEDDNFIGMMSPAMDADIWGYLIDCNITEECSKTYYTLTKIRCGQKTYLDDVRSEITVNFKGTPAP